MNREIEILNETINKRILELKKENEVTDWRETNRRNQLFGAISELERLKEHKGYIFYSIETIDDHKKYICENLQFATYNELLKAIKPGYILRRIKEEEEEEDSNTIQTEEEWFEENAGVGQEL